MFIYVLAMIAFTPRAEVGCCNADSMDHKAGNIYSLALYKKRLPSFKIENKPLWISKVCLISFLLSSRLSENVKGIVQKQCSYACLFSSSKIISERNTFFIFLRHQKDYRPFIANMSHYLWERKEGSEGGIKSP